MNFKKLINEGLDSMMTDIKNLQPSGQNPQQNPQQNPEIGNNPAPTSQQSDIKVARYKNSRNFGVWKGEELIVVAVYQKGANRVAEILQKMNY